MSRWPQKTRFWDLRKSASTQVEFFTTYANVDRRKFFTNFRESPKILASAPPATHHWTKRREDSRHNRTEKSQPAAPKNHTARATRKYSEIFKRPCAESTVHILYRRTKRDFCLSVHRVPLSGLSSSANLVKIFHCDNGLLAKSVCWLHSNW